MDILAHKAPRDYNHELKRIIAMLSYPRRKIYLKGSSALASQHYFSDYDLLTAIPTNASAHEVFDFFDRLMDRIEADKWLFFIELKLQTRDGQKYRWFPKDDLDEATFTKHYAHAEFIKIDLVDTRERFIEISCIYQIQPTEFTTEEYLKNLKADIAELKKEGNYYKILKRLFSVFKTTERKPYLLELTELFNSSMGEIYQNLSSVEAILKVLEHYKDPLLTRKAELALKELEAPPLDEAEKWLTKRWMELNEHVKPIALQYLNKI